MRTRRWRAALATLAAALACIATAPESKPRTSAESGDLILTTDDPSRTLKFLVTSSVNTQYLACDIGTDPAFSTSIELNVLGDDDAGGLPEGHELQHEGRSDTEDEGRSRTSVVAQVYCDATPCEQTYELTIDLTSSADRADLEWTCKGEILAKPSDDSTVELTLL